MKNFSRKTIAVASLLLSLPLAGCQVNAEEAAKSRQAVGETTCAISTKTFDATTAAQPNLALADLPIGTYKHVSVDFYVDSVRTRADGKKDISRVHFAEAPGARAGTFTTALRCREVSGNFSGYFVQGALVVDFKNYDKTRFDHSSNSYALDFLSATAPKFTPAFSGDVRSASAASFAGTITGYWNNGFRFARRSGETYEFYGVRIDSGTGATIYGKAVYTRTNAL